MASHSSKRSIDDIIGSIRNIVEGSRNAPNGHTVANDDVGPLVDLTDLPDAPRASHPVTRGRDRHAEPVAAPFMQDDLEATVLGPVDTGDYAGPEIDEIANDHDALEPTDSGQLAEIAATVERNLEWMTAPPASARRPAAQPQYEKFEALKATIDRPAPKPRPPIEPLRLESTEIAAIGAPMPAAEPLQVQDEGVDAMLDEAMLRPIIREWLDDNLPPIVERLVREELRSAIDGRSAARSR